MASLRYEMNFGNANAGGVPTFDFFVRQDTGAALSQPTITEAPWLHGSYYFNIDWSTQSATTISWKASLNGIEDFGVESAPSASTSGTSTATGGSTSLVGYATVLTIINRVAVQIGLSTVADPYASTDPHFIQLLEFLRAVGSELLLNRHQWTHLIKKCTITTAASATTYAMPADYSEMVDQTGWNTSMVLPMMGPLSAQTSEFLIARLSGVLVRVGFRLQGNLINFPTAPSNSQTLTFEYLSSYWVQTASATTGPDADHPTASTDYVLYDPDLMVAGVRLYWRTAKGLDTQKDEERFEALLEAAISKNYGARTLQLGGLNVGVDHLIDGANLPITGYG